ncbi:MAG: TIGR02186 family protein [Alphaproteobacteria bacterium]
MIANRPITRLSASWLRLPLFALAVFAILQIPADAAKDSALAVDLSEELIGISTGFTGANVLLFGATSGDGEVIVLIRSPDSRVVVRRKARVAGIWINSDELTFDDAPGFYHVASSAPVADLLPLRLLETNQVGVENIIFRPHEFLTPGEEQAFRDALVRNKQRSGLYPEANGTVAFQGTSLFRTRVELPSNVPTGQYSVTVLLVRNQDIVERTTTELSVRKVGIEAKVTEFAFEHAPVYGILAVFIALIAGWFAGFVFRKV